MVIVNIWNKPKPSLLLSLTNPFHSKLPLIVIPHTGFIGFISCTHRHVHVYVGCISRKLKLRISEHIGAAKRATDTLYNISSVSRHFRDTNDGDLSSLKVVGIERVFMPRRGGNWFRRLLMREALWILKSDSRSLSGLNLRMDLMYLY